MYVQYLRRRLYRSFEEVCTVPEEKIVQLDVAVVVGGGECSHHEQVELTLVAKIHFLLNNNNRIYLHKCVVL